MTKEVEIPQADGTVVKKTVTVYTVSKISLTNGQLQRIDSKDIWEGMRMSRGKAFSFVGGRGEYVPGTNGQIKYDSNGKMILFDNSFDPHIHFEGHRVDKGVVKESINLVSVANEWQIPVVAADGTAVLGVTWNNDLATSTQQGFWVNGANNLIFFRAYLKTPVNT